MATPFDDDSSHTSASSGSDIESETPAFDPVDLPAPSIVVCTYAFMGGEEIQYVLEELIDGSPGKNPDLIALQSICKMDYVKVLRFLKNKGYVFVGREETKSADFGEILFSKFQILAAKYIPFTKTCQSRGVTAYQINVKPIMPTFFSGEENCAYDSIWVCTSQLEDDSSAGASFRKQQIQELNKIFTNEQRVIFAGDTCITAYQTGSHKTPEGWIDAWKEKGTEEEKITFRLETDDPDTGDRRDQIWVKGLGVKEFGIAYDDDRSGIYAVVELI